MFERSQIEKLLVSHGVNPTAPDEEIRAVLLSAEWHKEDVDAALYVLRENPTARTSHVDALHQVFRTDERLRPETVRSLLGIDMEISSRDVLKSRHRARGTFSITQIVNIALVSVVLAMVTITLIMWYTGSGIFHYTGL